MLRIVKILKTENRMVVVGDSGEFLFIWYKFSDFQDEKNYGNGRWRWLHDNANVFNTTEPHTEK